MFFNKIKVQSPQPLRLPHNSSSAFRFPNPNRARAVKATLQVQYPADPTWPIVDKSLEQQMLDAVNAHRIGMGLNSLAFNNGLIGNSEWKARNMAQFQYMQHDDPAESAYNNFPGRTVGSRFNDWGFGSVAWGENIAYGFTDVQSCLNAFLSDAGHKSNVESRSWLSAGMGVCQATNGLIFWVQDYSSVSGNVPTPPPPPPPNTTYSIWLNNDLPLLQKSAQYRNWAKSNPNEASNLTVYINTLVLPSPMNTSFGKFLAGTIKLLSGS